MFIDYTFLDLKITNKTENTICIDSKEEINTVFVLDENNVKYEALLNENSEDLNIRKGMTENLKLKFNKMYNPNRNIKWIYFRDIVLNYDNYLNNKNKKNTMELKVAL